MSEPLQGAAPNSIWFSSSQSWVIPVIDQRGPFERPARAAQVVQPGAAWTFGARYPEDVFVLEQAQVGDWVVETADGHRYLMDAATFMEKIAVDPESLWDLAADMRSQSEEQRVLAGYQDGEAYHRALAAANHLMSFSDACQELAERGRWPGAQEDPAAKSHPANRLYFLPSAEPAKEQGQNEIVQSALEKMRQAFSGDLPLTVWITRTVRQEIPAGVVQDVMRAISEHGGDDGGRVSFDSLARHRDTALDALLRSGSEHTMGIPIEDSLSQKQWDERGIRASSRMVDLAREMLAPLEMDAIKNAHPGDVVALPFNQDGYFDKEVAALQKANPMSRDDTRPSAAHHDGEGA